MWCRNCQQDVPAVAAAGNSALICCARCGVDLHGRDDNSAEAAPPYPVESPAPLRLADSGGASALDGFDDWKLDDELREAQRLVNKIKAQSEPPENLASDEPSDASTGPRRAVAPRDTAGRGARLLAWARAGRGLAGLGGGCALLFWSIVSRRPELWTVGLPVALVSQVVLIFGMLLRRHGPVDFDNGQRPRAVSSALEQVQASSGGMQPSGVSVHFSNSSGAVAALDTKQLTRQIETVMRRHRAA